MGRVFNAIQHIVEVRREGMQIFRIERSNKGLIQPRVNFVDDIVALLFQDLNSQSCLGELRIAGFRAVEQQRSSF